MMLSSEPAAATNCLAHVQGLLFDLDGVVYRGLDPLPGAAELTATLGRLHIRFAFVTNNATLTPGQFRAKLAVMGVRVRSRDVVTSSEATAAYLQTVAAPGTGIYVVGEHGLHAAHQRAGFDTASDHPAYVVVGLHRRLTYSILAGACLAIQRGAQLIATNADRAIPVEAGLWPGAGAILAAITTATRAVPLIIGKPEPIMLEVALKRLGVDRAHVAMVGDQVETDIRAGQAARLRTVLVQGDLVAGVGDPPPTLVVQDLAELLAKIEAARTAPL